MEELKSMQSTVITHTNYEEYKTELRNELNKAAESFIRIGYLLKIARDTGILKDSGYENVNEFAEREFGLDKTQVSRFIRINDRFSEDGYSENLKVEYRGFGYAKLSIMLLLPDNINEELTPDYSKSEIQQIKDEIDEESKVTDIEVMLEKKDEMQQSLNSNLKKAVYQIGKDETEIFKRLWEAARRDKKTGKQFMEELIPAGKAVYSVRIPGAGRYMLSVKEEEDIVKLINVREQDQNETYQKQEVEEAFREILLEAGTWKEAWEKEYGEKLPEEKEVAPVQPKSAPRKESKVIKTDKKKEQKEEKPKEQTLHDVNPEFPAPNPVESVSKEEESVSKEEESVSKQEEQIPGQDEIMNHPEYMPQKTRKQLLEDAKLAAGAVKFSLEGYKDDIPARYAAELKKRAEHLVELLGELEEQDEDTV